MTRHEIEAIRARHALAVQSFQPQVGETVSDADPRYQAQRAVMASLGWDAVPALLSHVRDLTDRLGRFAEDLHRLSCDGAFSIDRDPMDLTPLFHCLNAGACSHGKAREVVRSWLAGARMPDIAASLPGAADYDSEEQALAEANRLRSIADGLAKVKAVVTTGDGWRCLVCGTKWLAPGDMDDSDLEHAEGCAYRLACEAVMAR